jgi:archaellum component FlaG (FlaF/FlaG flagellin family)
VRVNKSIQQAQQAVSVSNKADFSTHTYQQDFHVTPNPKKIIQLNGSDKQGRYVRIQ